MPKPFGRNLGGRPVKVSLWQRGRRWWVRYTLRGKRVARPLRDDDGRAVVDQRLADFLRADLEMKLAQDALVEPERESVGDVLEIYLAQGTRSQRTVEELRRVLVTVIARIGGQTASPHRLTVAFVQDWMAEMSRTLRPRTIKHYRSYLRTFCEFLVGRGQLTRNPVDRVRPPKVSKTPPKFLYPEQRDDLVRTARGTDAFPHVLLWAHAGLRVSEGAGLLVRQIDLKKRELNVLGKGSKWRRIPMRRILIKELVPLLKGRKADDIAFPLHLDLPGRGKARRRIEVRGARESLSRWCRRLAKRAGIETPFNVSPHVLRHTFVTLYLMGGGSIFKISKWLGHTTLAITETYGHYIPEIGADEIEVGH